MMSNDFFHQKFFFLMNEWIHHGKKIFASTKVDKTKKVNGRHCCKSKMILLWVIIFAHQKFISLMNEFIHDHGKHFWFASHKRSGIIIKYSFKMCSNYCNYHIIDLPVKFLPDSRKSSLSNKFCLMQKYDFHIF